MCLNTLYTGVSDSTHPLDATRLERLGFEEESEVEPWAQEAFEGIDPEEDSLTFQVRHLEHQLLADRREIESHFREQVREDFSERFSDGWDFEGLMAWQQHHLQRGVNIWGDSLAFPVVLSVLHQELGELTEIYPHSAATQ